MKTKSQKGGILLIILILGFLSTNVIFAVSDGNLITKNLSVGLKNDAQVKILQKLLIEKGFLNSEVTGTFGSKTLVAVKSFQKKNKISQTGTVGPKTMAVINTLLSKSTQQNVANGGIQTPQPTVIISPPLIPQPFVVPPIIQASTPNPPPTIQIELPAIVSQSFLDYYPPKFQGTYTTTGNSSDAWLEYSYNGVTTTTPKVHSYQSGTVAFTVLLGEYYSVVYSGKIFVSNEVGTVSTNQFGFRPTSTTGPLSFIKTMPIQISDISGEATRYYSQFHTYDSFCPVAIYEVLATHLTSFVPSCSTGPADWSLTFTKQDGKIGCISQLGIRDSVIQNDGSWSCPVAL